MLRMIKSELYKTAHRKYPYVLVGVMSALILSFVALIAVQRGTYATYVHMEDVVYSVIPMLSIGIYLVLMMVDMVFSDEYKNQTMKNTLAFGTPRATVYLGKLISSLIVAVLSLLALLAVLFGGSYLLLGVGDATMAAGAVRMFFERLTACLPLFIGALGTANLLAFTIRSNGLFVTTFVAVFALGAQFCDLLAYVVSPIFNTVRGWLLMPQFDAVFKSQMVLSEVIGKCLIVGLGYAIVATVVGLALFQRKEIK